MFSHLPAFFTAPLGKTARTTTLFWFCLSLTCTALLGLMTLKVAFASEYVVQDDVRQHVFWMRRFVDPTLLPKDLIADYFQSVAPWGYTTVYRILAAIGLDPLIASKLLPLPLALISIAYCFGATLQILPVPFAGFVASLLLNQNLLMADDLNSATPRAFLYPLFLAFLYYFLRRSLLPCVASVGLLGLFYPQVMFIAGGVLVLALVQWEGRRPQLSRQRQDYVFCGLGLTVAAIVLLIYIFTGGTEFGPTVKAAQARTMLEFWGSGRGSFFDPDPIAFWLFAGRSGFLPHPEQMLKPPLLLTGLLLPLLLRLPDRFPLAQQVTQGVRVLLLTLLSSTGLFLAAHALIFRLHHPSRYTQHSLRIVLAIAAGVTLTLLLDAVLRWATMSNNTGKRLTAWGTVVALSLVLLVYPATARLQGTSPWLNWFVPTYLLPGFGTAKDPALYQFFAQQPKDSLIASIASEADNLPTFARRSILVGREYGIPYHVGYYRQFRQRAIDLLRAQYSPDLAQVRHFTQQYGVNFWLLDRDAFTPEYLAAKDWIQQYQPDATNVENALKQGVVPVVQKAIDRCAVFNQNNLIVLPTACVVDSQVKG